MRRKRFWTSICLLAAAIGSLKVVQSLQARSFSETLRQQAVRESAASTTAADAKAWLERNGFDVAMFYENGVQASELTRQTSQGQEKFNTVDGYRKVSNYPLLGERWIQLTFLFQTTQEPYVPGAFVGVEIHDNSSPSKVWRNEFARRAARKVSPSTGPQ